MVVSSVGKIPTGIPGLDEITNGGFPRNGIIALSGGIGVGKTIFGLQYLYKGAEEHNEVGAYIGFEEPKRLLYRNMLKFGWNLKALENDQKFVYLQFPPHEVDQFYEQEDTLISLIDKLNIQRVVFDPATLLALPLKTPEERKTGMLRLIDRLRKWGATVILINDNYDFPELACAVESVADGVIYLYNILQSGNRRRALEVYEMRGGPHSMQIHPFRIGSDGIEVDVNSVVKLDNVEI